LQFQEEEEKMGGKRNATNKIIKKQKANITYICNICVDIDLKESLSVSSYIYIYV